MEKRSRFFPKRSISLNLKAEKEKKNMDMQHRGSELQEKNNNNRKKKNYKSGIK